MVENTFSLFGRPLIFAAPMLLVYVIALVLALVNIRRAPLAAVLTLAASVILLVASITVPVLQSLLIRSSSLRSPALELVAMAGSVVRALGTFLLVAAIFAGRGKTSGLGA